VIPHAIECFQAGIWNMFKDISTVSSWLIDSPGRLLVLQVAPVPSSTVICLILLAVYVAWGFRVWDGLGLLAWAYLLPCYSLNSFQVV